jgi:uncharacterized OsmC-like protein
MTPIELLAASLASCIAYYAVRYGQRHQISTEGLEVILEWDYAEHPHRIGRLSAEVRLPALPDPSVRQRLQKVLEGCTVHRTLETPPEISVRIEEIRKQRPS